MFPGTVIGNRAMVQPVVYIRFPLIVRCCFVNNDRFATVFENLLESIFVYSVTADYPHKMSWGYMPSESRSVKCSTKNRFVFLQIGRKYFNHLNKNPNNRLNKKTGTIVIVNKKKIPIQIQMIIFANS